MSDRIRIILIDDHPLFRDGVTNVLNQDPGIEIVAIGENSDDAMSLTAEFLPDIALLDVSMPGSGVMAAKHISSEFPVVKIIMLTASEHDEDVLGSLNHGASGYVLKGVSGKELIGILKDIYNGGSYVSPGLAARLLLDIQDSNIDSINNTGFENLTAREEQILKCIAKGLSNKEIGESIGIAEKTVKHYVTNILQKLHVRNRVEAAIFSQRMENKNK